MIDFILLFEFVLMSTHWRETTTGRRGWACNMESNFQLIWTRTSPRVLDQLIDGSRCPQKTFRLLDAKNDMQALRSGVPAVPSEHREEFRDYFIGYW